MWHFDSPSHLANFQWNDPPIRIHARMRSKPRSGTDPLGTHTCQICKRQSSIGARLFPHIFQKARISKHCKIGRFQFWPAKIVCIEARKNGSCLVVILNRRGSLRPSRSCRNVARLGNSVCLCLGNHHSCHRWNCHTDHLIGHETWVELSFPENSRRPITIPSLEKRKEIDHYKRSAGANISSRVNKLWLLGDDFRSQKFEKIGENRQNRGKGYISAILPALDILFFSIFHWNEKA